MEGVALELGYAVSNLLQVIRLGSKNTRKGAVPLVVEFPVGPETAPYLVSSSTTVMWIGEPPIVQPRPMVKAAVREVEPDVFFQEVLEAVLIMGRDAEWGNVHPLTHDGLRAAIDHVESYGLTDLELLASPNLPKDALKAVVGDLAMPVRPSSWVPTDCVIVLPKDREYVGILAKVTDKRMAGVIHNASRGIGIACDRSA